MTNDLHSGNRIGSKCWWMDFNIDGWRRGTVLAWARDHDGDPAAVIEDSSDHGCHGVCAEHISFAKEKPIDEH